MKIVRNDVIPYLQVGTGRLGKTIIAAIQAESELADLSASEVGANFRIDPVLGLTLVNSCTGPLTIDKLLICIAPGVTKKWRWDNIFGGLARQVEDQQLLINELIFISSTRVYDGIQQGVISSEDTPLAGSDRARSLLAAEKQLAQLANKHCFLRCCGLIGEQYQRFQEILRQPDDKVRFAVDIELIANKVVQRLLSNNQFNQHSIITDGNCYYRGNQLAFKDSLFLSKQHRLLRKSDSFQ